MQIVFISFLILISTFATAFLSSIFGMITVPNQSAYHVTKFGVRGFSEALSKELSNTNVSVHCVHPGHIGTNIVSNARMTSGPKQNDALQRIMSKLLPIGTSQREMSEFFQKYGMHPSRAANIILNGIKRNKKRKKNQEKQRKNKKN